ncbi:MAG TPA: hypothetical protein VGJ05_20540 [Fimbriiglobus sp.]
MRKFKHFRRQLSVFVVRAVEGVTLELDRSKPVADFRTLACERLLVDVIGQPQVEQPILLLHKQRLLTLEFRPLGQ